MTQSTDFLAELAALAEKGEAGVFRGVMPNYADGVEKFKAVAWNHRHAILALGRELEECDAREAGLTESLSAAALREERLGRERDALREALEDIARENRAALEGDKP